MPRGYGALPDNQTYGRLRPGRLKPPGGREEIPDAIESLVRTVFGTSAPVTWERTPDGVSTQVYRLARGSEVFYLRVAEHADENLETEAELHQRLRDLDVKVADIIHVEPFDTAIGRSTMITTEIPGAPLTSTSSPELALRAEHTAYPSFVTSELPQPWPGPLSSLFSTVTVDAITELIDQQLRQPPAGAHLAHGDFDLSPIFCADGHYTGLIDFGEIQGTEPLFDLAHFHLHDRESHPTVLLPALLRGYQRILALPANHEESIRRSAILLGLRQLCRWLDQPGRTGSSPPESAGSTNSSTSAKSRRRQRSGPPEKKFGKNSVGWCRIEAETFVAG